MVVVTDHTHLSYSWPWSLAWLDTHSLGHWLGWILIALVIGLVGTSCGGCYGPHTLVILVALVIGLVGTSCGGCYGLHALA